MAGPTFDALRYDVLDHVAHLTDWLHRYNHHRFHTALGGPPISRVNDPAGHYS